MDYLQYNKELEKVVEVLEEVLNLIINGLPSIQTTSDGSDIIYVSSVLNLIINGLPSIL